MADIQLVEMEVAEATEGTDQGSTVRVVHVATEEAVEPPHYDETVTDRGPLGTLRFVEIVSEEAVEPPHYDETLTDRGPLGTIRLSELLTNEAVEVDDVFYKFAVIPPKYLVSPVIGVI